jgi:putative transposase
MDRKGQEEIALHRWAVIAEAAGDRLTAAERGALVRQIAARAHTHPDGSARRYSRGTIDRWLRAWRAGGLDALKPSPRADAGAVRAHPELFAEAAALRLELPGRSAAQIASILFHRHGIAVAERTIRAQLRRAGLHREALAASRKPTAGMRPRARTSGGSATCWSAPGCLGPAGTVRCGRGCF